MKWSFSKPLNAASRNSNVASATAMEAMTTGSRSRALTTEACLSSCAVR